MYSKSKNKILFFIFTLVILLIVSILVISVYRIKDKKNIEEYKISLNNVVYDDKFSYISLENDSILKKEWDKKYYLYPNKSSKKYSLGTETVFYDKAKNQVSVYGTIYQVYPNGDISEKKEKTIIGSLNDFQFFKLNDRKYLLIGSTIKSENFSTSNYLIVSIDKAGNCLLINNDVNIKTINPLILDISGIKFDIANEKLINGEDEIDLKKINGSTNEYEEKDDEKNNNDENPGNTSNGNSDNNNGSSNSPIYNEIINQIINLGSFVTNKNPNKTNLYKNISLRSVNVGASYIDVFYSVIDPEDKYLSVFLSVKDPNENVKFYYLSKDTESYRISGLLPNNQYSISMNYIVSGSSASEIADTVIVLTSTDPTSVKITKINGNVITYNVKMYNEYEFSSANVVLTNCEDDNPLGIRILNIQNAISTNGDSGEFTLDSNYLKGYVCLSLKSVKDLNDNEITINSYNKIKIG